MSDILDSGSRREFESGAVRDIAEGKGRCDLLPLITIGKLYDMPELIYIGNFIYSGDESFIRHAIRCYELRCEFDIFSGLLEVSKHYEDGAKKYAERNWEKGIPAHCFVDSAVRHYLKYMRGDVDEPHDRAYIWNLLGLLWTIDNRPEFNDLPYANKVKEDNMSKKK